jgi:hypothetical protein
MPFREEKAMRSSTEETLRALTRGAVATIAWVGIGLVSPTASRADVLCVNTDGSGGCYTSVAAAVDDAGPRDEVQVAPGTYIEPVISVSYVRKRVRGSGAGVTIIQWSGLFGFDVGGLGARLDLSDLTIEGPASRPAVWARFNGRLDLARVEIRGAEVGVSNFGVRATITDSTIHSNLDVGVQAGNRFRMTGSTVHSNGSDGVNFVGSNVTIEDCTVSGNAGTEVYVRGSATLRNSTIVGDSTVEGDALRIGALGSTKIEASVVSDDAGAVPGLPDVQNDGKLASRGYNLFKDGFSGDPPTGKTAFDLVGVNPLLGPLADNGGPTHTHALAPGSPALEAVLPKRSCRRPDQRGVAREPAPCDVGAFEAP